jgi:hypothetical protein
MYNGSIACGNNVAFGSVMTGVSRGIFMQRI